MPRRISECKTPEDKIENIRYRLADIIKCNVGSPNFTHELWEAIHENDFTDNYTKFFLIMNALTFDGRYAFNLKITDEWYELAFGWINKPRYENKYCTCKLSKNMFITVLDFILEFIEKDLAAYGLITVNDNYEVIDLPDTEDSKNMVKISFITRKENAQYKKD